MEGEGADVTNKTRRINFSWNPELDELLVRFLQELCLMGNWKVDTGFRAGYLVQLEKMFREKVSGCAVKATPHIQSRVKLLKTQCLAIHEMLTKGSGFSWCDANKYVVCERDIYERWVQSHPTAKALFKKPFPHYDVLIDIFSNDYANGVRTESVADGMHDLHTTRETTTQHNMPVELGGREGVDIPSDENSEENISSHMNNDSNGTPISTQPISAPPTETQPITPTTTNNPSSSTPCSHKRSNINVLDGGSKKACHSSDLASSISEIAAAIGSLTESSRNCMHLISTTLAPDVDPMKALAEVLLQMDWLSSFEKLKVTSLIGKEQSFVQLVLMTSDVEREEMTRHILAHGYDE